MRKSMSSTILSTFNTCKTAVILPMVSLLLGLTCSTTVYASGALVGDPFITLDNSMVNTSTLNTSTLNVSTLDTSQDADIVNVSASTVSDNDKVDDEADDNATTTGLDGASDDVLHQAYTSFQQDADIIRLRHLKHWVELVEEYHQKTGKYPLQGMSDNELYVEVATPMQKADIKQSVPKPAITKSMKLFVETLEEGLGREIDELYDPQYKADGKPNFYIYMIDGDRYYFAIHTHTQYLFGKSVVYPYYNKVEVSNVYDPSRNLIVTSDILFNSKYYQDEANKSVHKLDFFTQRTHKTLHASKDLQ